ncbi:hypothetical protein PsorP6_003768 [Peronosclerospora sorghi]|uniref:Uncharacterized protein n=1 Tax=Peronosclerospora sorghi TaxID=230839 RepID=A0ACC0VRT2_9STRA|nr:hypothetical protein PsorP6_003768 [Peronosclerospora sorghi]
MVILSLLVSVTTSTTEFVEETDSRVDCYPPRANFPETTEVCLAQGFCWKSLENGGIPCAFPAAKTPTAQCENVPKVLRISFRSPRFALLKVLEDADTCGSVGCCFDDGECFQPMAKGYELLTLDKTTDGWRGTLALQHESHGTFGNDLALLELNVVRLSTNQVRIHITDPEFPRYDVPDMPVRRQEENADEEEDFQVHFTPRPFGVSVSRRHSGELLFNSTTPVEKDEDGARFSGLIYENQFIEISTQLTCNDDDNPILYGLGWDSASTC